MAEKVARQTVRQIARPSLKKDRKETVILTKPNYGRDSQSETRKRVRDGEQVLAEGLRTLRKLQPSNWRVCLHHPFPLARYVSPSIFRASSLLFLSPSTVLPYGRPHESQGLPFINFIRKGKMKIEL